MNSAALAGFGRIPSPQDERDYRLASYMPAEWALAARPTAQVLWTATAVLNQGRTPHCVGFAGAGFGNTLPVNSHLHNRDGHALYYECKIVDSEPREENGSTVRSIAKVLKARGHISGYAFSASLDEIQAWVLHRGPMIVGTDWDRCMSDPDPAGFAYPSGNLTGGHAYLLIGYDPGTDVFTFLNSWGVKWGLRGCFKMTRRDWWSVFTGLGGRDGNGEALAAVELPVK